MIAAPANGSLTTNPRPAISGTGAANATINLSIDSGGPVSVAADGGGNWSYTPPADLTNAAHTARATQTIGSITSANSNAPGFTVAAPPTVSGITPNQGPLAGANSVTIAGTNLAAATAVAFAANSATITGASETALTVTVPSGTGAVTVTVTTPGGTATGSYTYFAAPVAATKSGVAVTYQTATPIDLSTSITGAHSSITVASGPAHGGTSVAGDVVTYTPTNGTAGADSFTYTATGPGGTSAPATVSVTVSTPTIAVAPTTLSAMRAGVAYSTTISASGGTASYGYTLTGGALPAGIGLASDGTLSGTPTATGAFSFTVTATDSFNFTGSRVYSGSVAAPIIVVAPGSLPNPGVGAAYSETLTASGGTATYSYGLSSGALPPGISLASNGAISGVSTASGIFNFTVTATDSTTGGTYTGSQSYAVNVGAPTIAVTPASLTAAAVGTPYSETLAASGGTAPYSFTLSAGALPAGISLASDGTLSGTATAAGSFNFTVDVQDSSGGGGPFTGSASYSLTVGAAFVTLAPATLPAAATAAAYSQTLTASGGTGPYDFTLQSGALPAGVSLTGAGVISGTPSAGGSFNFVVRATDNSTGAGAPFHGDLGYTLSVSAPTVTLASASLANATVANAYAASLPVATGGHRAVRL